MLKCLETYEEEINEKYGIQENAKYCGLFFWRWNQQPMKDKRACIEKCKELDHWLASETASICAALLCAPPAAICNGFHRVHLTTQIVIRARRWPNHNDFLGRPLARKSLPTGKACFCPGQCLSDAPRLLLARPDGRLGHRRWDRMSCDRNTTNMNNDE